MSRVFISLSTKESSFLFDREADALLSSQLRDREQVIIVPTNIFELITRPDSDL